MRWQELSAKRQFCIISLAVWFLIGLPILVLGLGFEGHSQEWLSPAKVTIGAALLWLLVLGVLWFRSPD
jgi:hypothetical protein